MRKLIEKYHQLVDLELLYDLINTTLKINQKKLEIIKLIKLFRDLNGIGNICEIGTQEGGSFLLLNKIAKDIIISIDCNVPTNKDLLEEITHPKGKLIVGKSHSVVSQVSDILDSKKVNLLFIDGDHSYKSVKSDFEDYYPLVAKDGFICFHDIALHSAIGRTPHDFWKEIKKNYKSYEIIQDKSQKGFGIGVIIEP